jgi:hypothetical protein
MIKPITEAEFITEGDVKKELNLDTFVISHLDEYDLSRDCRKLIPIIRGQKIGFVDSVGKLLVEPKYDRFVGEVYNSSDIIRVATNFVYEYHGSANYVSHQIRWNWGILDSLGCEVIPPKYRTIIPSADNMLFSLQSHDGVYKLIGRDGNIIVPEGIYDYIDGVWCGYARVFKCGEDGVVRWGIIDETGNEVVPLIYTDIWKFYGQDKYKYAILVDDVFQYKFNLGSNNQN